MSVRAFDTLVPRLQQSVPGCPDHTLIQYARDAAIRVCERTLVWRYEAPLFALRPGVFRYDYDKPRETDVHVLFEALLNEHPIERVSLETALARYPGWAVSLDRGKDDDGTSGVVGETLFDGAMWGGATPNDDGVSGVVGETLDRGKDDDGVSGVVGETLDRTMWGGSEPRVITQLTPDTYIVLPSPDTKTIYSMRVFFALKPSRDATSMDAAVFDELEDAIVHNALQSLLVLPDVGWSDRQLASYHAKQFLAAVVERRARANLGNMRSTLRAMAPRFA